MATFHIQMDVNGNTKRLVAAPDWVIGTIKDGAFAGSTASEGVLEACHFDEYVIRDLIDYLSNKITNKYAANTFKDILFRIYNAINGNSDLESIFTIDIKLFTYLINLFKTENYLARKFNYYLPPTNRNKQKHRLLYMLVSLQHVICSESSRPDLRIPTVTKI